MWGSIFLGAEQCSSQSREQMFKVMGRDQESEWQSISISVFTEFVFVCDPQGLLKHRPRARTPETQA